MICIGIELLASFLSPCLLFFIYYFLQYNEILGKGASKTVYDNSSTTLLHPLFKFMKL